MAKILDGVALGQEVRAEVAVGVAEMQERHGVTPGLAAVLVGGDPASAIYVRNKGRACDEAGMFSEIFHLDAVTAEAELLDLVAKLNADSRFHGILVQLPLPPQIEETVIIEALDPAKDVDGLHPFNLGKLLQGVPDFVSGDPRRHSADTSAPRLRSGRKHVGGVRPQQHRGQTPGDPAAAATRWFQRHCDRYPHPYRQSA